MDQNWYKLSAVVDHWLLDNSLGDGWFPLALVRAKAGLREIRLDIFQEVKTALYDVTDRKTVKLPINFVDWVIIAAPKGQYAQTLGVNTELKLTPRTTTDQTIRGLLSQHMPNGVNSNGYMLMNFDGGTLFSWGQGLPSKGYWKISDTGECKELLLDYDYSLTQVYVESITDGLEPCGETMIHPYEFDYLQKYLDMKFEKKNNPKASLGSKDEADRDVFWAEKKLRARRNPIGPQDVLNVSRQEARLTPHL